MELKEKEIRTEDLKETARALLHKLENAQTDGGATVVGLIGELGAGKTAFVQALAGELGIRERVISPTFVIEKIYKLSENRFSHLVHIDAYRLKDGQELKTLGWDELVKDAGNLIVVEWADRILDIFPQNARILRFEIVNENTRRILHSYYDEK